MKAEVLNDFFIDIGTINYGNTPTMPPVIFKHTQWLNTIVFDYQSVYMVIKNLPFKSTCGF